MGDKIGKVRKNNVFLCLPSRVKSGSTRPEEGVRSTKSPGTFPESTIKDSGGGGWETKDPDRPRPSHQTRPKDSGLPLNEHGSGGKRANLKKGWVKEYVSHPNCKVS